MRLPAADKESRPESAADCSPLRSIYSAWWPLAASWLMMGLELPAVGAVMARLPDPSIHLAAYGGVVFPLSLVIEAPIIMLLAASTALSKDLESYVRLRRFMVQSALALGLLHALVALTPLYEIVVDAVLGIPVEIQGPARTGMILMIPWTPMIAYRRFQQGILIRFGRSRAVGIGTALRLGTNALVLATGYHVGGISGIAVGTAAVSAGVIAEAIYAGIAVRPILRGPLRDAPPVAVPLTTGRLLRFYVPLAITPLFVMLGHPIVSAAVSRMPRAIDSLAVWPVLNGLVFTLRSLGFAFNEVVVVKLDDPECRSSLRRFALLLGGAVTFGLLLVTVTPLSGVWFARVSALAPELSRLAGRGLWIALLMPAFSVVQSYFQGHLVHVHRTREVTEAVVLYLGLTALILAVGVGYGKATGLFFGLAAILAGNGAQAAWLWYRSRSVRES